jgi:hypothetical protein
MKKISLLIIGLIALASMSFALPNSFSKAPSGTVYNNPSGYIPQLNAPSEVSITHSTNQVIVPGNSVSCNAGSLHNDNSYYRVFDLQGNFSINTNFIITHLEVGIESASGASGSQPVAVRLHTLNGVLSNANLTLLYSETFSVPDQTLSIYNFVLATPVLVPVGETLVVEIFTPSGQSLGNSFFIGSNATATASPSYISAAACGVTEPTNVASLGFPGMNIVMNVYGANAVVPVPYGYIASAFLLIALALFIRRRFY